MRPLLICALAVGLSTAGGAYAQIMFKCVGADGKIAYSDQPCSGKIKAEKELDVRANLDDAERENRRKAARLEREREEKMYNAQAEKIAGDPQTQRMEKQIRLMEGTDGPRRPTTYEEIKADTQKRVKADEEERAKASALWKCKRGPEPEKCI